MVKVVINGQGILTSIKINPDAVDKDDVEALEDLVMAAINAANKKRMILPKQAWTNSPRE